MKGMKRLIGVMMACFMTLVMLPAAAFADEPGEQDVVQQILEGMTLDEKISQMIIPAIRTWNEEPVTDLEQVPELAQALRSHQYGGIILYGSNVVNTGQVAKLVSDLQVNNAAIEGASVHIPYFMAVDEEGGIVTRLTTGTRMTGSMAIGATGENALENAKTTGRVIGEELAALGFNVDFAPDIDVNNNAANPVIGTRSFSDDPQVVAELGAAYAGSLEQEHIIATYKHFPGHGDTGVDSHIGTPSVEKTYDQLREIELVPFRAAIEAGADMIMTAHITYPLIDEEQTFGDGETHGYYPATMSEKMITQILRQDMGYEGVVVTDALEMDAIMSAGLVPGDPDSAEYRTNIAEKVINAGVDILLVPMDLNSEDAAVFYDTYIEGIEDRIANGLISEARIDESVTHILQLKEKYQILNANVSGSNLDQIVQDANRMVGSDEHHAAEMEIAMQAITMVKNDNVLPAKGEGSHIVFAGRNADDDKTILYALRQLMEQGVIDPNAKIVDLIAGETSGAEDAATVITVDYYFDPSAEDSQVHYTDDLRAAVANADLTVCLSKTFSLDAMANESAQYQGISSILSDTHASGGKTVLLSDNLPYDAARYQNADAILLAYMGSGLDMDPTSRADGSANLKAYNANIVAAIHLLFGDGNFKGTLPVNIPAIITQEDGTLAYSNEILYQRGYGLVYSAQTENSASNPETQDAENKSGDGSADPAGEPESDESEPVIVDYQQDGTPIYSDDPRIVDFNQDGLPIYGPSDHSNQDEEEPVIVDYQQDGTPIYSDDPRIVDFGQDGLPIYRRSED